MEEDSRTAKDGDELASIIVKMTKNGPTVQVDSHVSSLSLIQIVIPALIDLSLSLEHRRGTTSTRSEDMIPESISENQSDVSPSDQLLINSLMSVVPKGEA